MAALSAAADRKTRNAESAKVHEFAVETGTTIYAGGLVALVTSTSRIQPAAVATGQANVVIGIAEENATGNTAGTVYCKTKTDLEALFSGLATQPTAGYLGATVYAKTDNEITTASDAGTGLVRVAVGRLVQKETSTTWWVHIGNVSDAAT